MNRMFIPTCLTFTDVEFIEALSVAFIAASIGLLAFMFCLWLVVDIARRKRCRTITLFRDRVS